MTKYLKFICLFLIWKFKFLIINFIIQKTSFYYLIRVFDIKNFNKLLKYF